MTQGFEVAKNRRGVAVQPSTHGASSAQGPALPSKRESYLTASDLSVRPLRALLPYFEDRSPLEWHRAQEYLSFHDAVRAALVPSLVDTRHQVYQLTGKTHHILGDENFPKSDTSIRSHGKNSGDDIELYIFPTA